MKHRALAVLVTAAATTLALPAADAATPKPPKVPKVKTRIAKVQIKVDGYIETRSLEDTASDCAPGERWIQTNTYDFDTGPAPVNIALQRVTMDGRDPIVTSPFTVPAGRTSVEGKISDYRTTNYCSGATVVNRPAPKCIARIPARTQISLQEAPLPALDDDELTPLNRSNQLMIAVSRKGGGNQNTECLGPPAGRLNNAPETAIATTSTGPGVSAVLPSGLTTMKLFLIRRGQTIRRTVTVSGPCTNPTVSVSPNASATPAAGNLNAHGDCFMTGKLIYSFRARPLPKQK